MNRIKINTTRIVGIIAKADWKILEISASFGYLIEKKA